MAAMLQTSVFNHRLQAHILTCVDHGGPLCPAQNVLHSSSGMVAIEHILQPKCTPHMLQAQDVYI